MAITFINSSETNNNSSGTSITVPAPAGVQAGDFLYLVMLVNANLTIAAPTGWSVWTQTPGTGMSYAVFYKLASSSEPASYTFSGLVSNRYQAMISAYRGVDQTTPVDVAVGKSTGTTTLIAFPAITPVTPGALILATRILQVASGVSMATLAFSSANMTVGNFTYSNASGTANQAAGNARQTWTSGAFTADLTSNVVFNQNRAVVGAIRPAATVTVKKYRGWGTPARN